MSNSDTKQIKTLEHWFRSRTNCIEEGANYAQYSRDGATTSIHGHGSKYFGRPTSAACEGARTKDWEGLKNCVCSRDSQYSYLDQPGYYRVKCCLVWYCIVQTKFINWICMLIWMPIKQQIIQGFLNYIFRYILS